MSQEQSTSSTPPRSRARRHARLSLKAKQARAAQAELAKLERRRAQEAAQQRQLDEAKAAIEALIAQDAEMKRAEMAARRPQTLIDFCREQGLPEDIYFHPRYMAVGVPPECPDQWLEAICFGRSWPTELGGLGGYGHLRNFITMTWPWVELNPWFEQTMRALSDDDYVTQIGKVKLRFVNLTGPGSASKTAAAGIFACAWFMVDFACNRKPRTSVTLTSTSKGIIAQRVWPIIQKCFHEATNHATGQRLRWGHMRDSNKLVLALNPDGTKAEEKFSILAVAVETGDISKAVDKIKGRHTERMLLIVDEANSTPQAIFDCIPNMLTSVKELIVLVIGNAISRLDPHGLCCEPAHGWKSISIDTPQWDTKGVAKWGIGPGVCLHFDGARSPNVIAGRTEYRYIYSYERWQHVQRMGEEYRNTIQHWSQDRGFWPPDGLQTTIFSEAMFISHDGSGTFNWLTSPIPLASLDPAFGGDLCILRRGQLGELTNGKRVIQLLERVVVPFDPDSPDSIEHQIAVFVIAKCKQWGVQPPYFGGDATGTGRGAMSAIEQLWSPRIHKIEFGGAADDLPASTEDPRPGHEIYFNKVTNLWYATKELLLCDQIKGFDLDTIKQFCSRFYSYNNRRYKAEPKDEMKARIGYSPDDADAVVVMVDVARKHGLIAMPTFGVQRRREVAASEPDDNADLLNTDYTSQNEFTAYADVA